MTKKVKSKKQKVTKNAKAVKIDENLTLKQKLSSSFRQYIDAYKAYRKEDKKQKKYRSFRLQKRIKPEPRVIPTSWQLLKSTFSFLYQHKTIFLVILCVHAVIYFGIARSPIDTDIESIQTSVRTILEDQGELQQNVATLGAVLNRTTNASRSSSSALTATIVCLSLVYIWAIRKLHADAEIRARDALYQGMAPLGSSMLILATASLQLIPFAVTSFVYATARANGLFTNGFEDLSIFMLCMLAALLSFYWMTSSVIALYVVTLPGVYPLEALRAGKKLVQFQRFTVFKRIIALPIAMVLVYFLVLMLFIRFASGQVFFLVDILQLLVLPIVHTYLFKLYRSLL